MEHPLTARRATTTALAVLAVAAAAACGGAQGEEDGDKASGAEAGAAAAKRLHEAQMAQFGEANVVPDRSELGAYSELSTTQRTDQMRKATELDKPQCMDAANQWGELPEVRDAPTSLATFARGDDTITHTLVELPEEIAEKAVAAEPPEECSRYEATMKDGSTTSYRLKEIDIEQVADDSRAFAVETEIGGDTVWLYSLVYRNGGYLGTTTMLGPNAKEDYRETVVAFTEKALEREQSVLA
ncbi:hypothetical protein LP52_24575 [Streptomonospora alba]|uniref:Uncharacterized protein n=1 Tax=Streptomonospora alba TaxID=183763 RepID=A0A0C2J553_9ACTN|nr:hypothetical protein [Streptomonospora alba]KIH96536.1 hypothetical protein LP52_24575 [Streptomonospora alba]